VPAVSALRRVGRDRIAVELDGTPWRTFPLEVVLAAGLDLGVELDRSRARRVARERRRVEARAAALLALQRREHTAASLRARLAERGIGPAPREEALAALERAGLVDDERYARGRAAALAARGCGDRMIRDDLARRGVGDELIDAALAALEPEPERARRLVETLGRSARTLRRLAARGFAEEALEPLEPLVANPRETELGC